MNSTEYQQLAEVTESKDFQAIRERMTSIRMIRLLHGNMGLESESGEVTDALKAHIFYGKPLDVVNIAEEISDIFWYIALICNELKISFDEIMEMNISKLKARYGDKFSTERAVNRDKNNERKVMEQTISYIPE